MARPFSYEQVLKAKATEPVPDSRRQIFRGALAGLLLSLLIAAFVFALSAGNQLKAEAHTNALARLSQRLYDSGIGTGIRESVWVFPIIEGTHLPGIALSVGMLCWFDLRLLGIALKDRPVSDVWRQVMPVALAGFVLMFITGLLLFWAEAIRAYGSLHFWIKIGLLAAAGINALVFETTAHRHMKEWDLELKPPRRARLAGAISLILWTAIIVTGRTMAYNF